MSRLLRVALATVFLVGALSATRLSLPGQMVACSCMPTNEAGPFTGEEDAVLIGTVGASDGRGVYEFTVERWFHGGDEAVVALQSSTQVLADGTTTIDTCGLSFEPGQRLIFAATRSGATLSPNSCAPYAAAASVEGQQLAAAAVVTFGEGTLPGSPPKQAADPSVDLALIAILVSFGIVIAVVLGVVVLAFGRRDKTETP
jgi:hypothetical protein